MSHPIDPASTETPQKAQTESVPAFEERVEALAAQPRLESAQVGFAAAPSEAHAAFRAVVEQATDEQLEQLLKHESPVVRGYVAGWLVTKHGPEHPALEPLRQDKAEVFTLKGCIGGMTTVGEMARGMWRLD
jgi:hypothetical protein